MMAKKVYTADSVSMAWHFRNVLEQHGISSVVKNDNLYSAGGELPLNECMPEVWVEHALYACLLYTSPSPRAGLLARMPSSA